MPHSFGFISQTPSLLLDFATVFVLIFAVLVFVFSPGAPVSSHRES
jgi:hypothetical protein